MHMNHLFQNKQMHLKLQKLIIKALAKLDDKRI